MSQPNPAKDFQYMPMITAGKPQCNLRDSAFLLTGEVGPGTCVPERVAARVIAMLDVCNDKFKAILRAGGWQREIFWQNVFRGLVDKWDHPIPPCDVIGLVQFILDNRMESRADPDLSVPASDLTRAADELLLNCYCARNKDRKAPIVDETYVDLPMEFFGPFYRHYLDVQRAKEGWEASLDSPDKLRLPKHLLKMQLIRENPHPS